MHGICQICLNKVIYFWTALLSCLHTEHCTYVIVINKKFFLACQLEQPACMPVCVCWSSKSSINSMYVCMDICFLMLVAASVHVYACVVFMYVACAHAHVL